MLELPLQILCREELVREARHWGVPTSAGDAEGSMCPLGQPGLSVSSLHQPLLWKHDLVTDMLTDSVHRLKNLKLLAMRAL